MTDGDKAPTLGVVIVAYNAAGFIADCLESLLAARQPGMRIIVVDNGSRDETAAKAPDTHILIRGKAVSSDVAMTGEITLTGQVLPVGGLKEKSLAAQRAGIKRVIVPARNEGEILEIPEHERADLEFVYVERIEEALEVALPG